MCLEAWNGHTTLGQTLLVGDNTASLQDALVFKGRCCLDDIARELDLRVATRSWKYSVGHLPSEYNSVPDALSRLEAPEAKPFPAHALAGATKIAAPDVGGLWSMKHTLPRE